MFQFRPIDALTGHGPHYSAAKWLLAYRHFAAALYAHYGDSPPCELLLPTTGVGYSSLADRTCGSFMSEDVGKDVCRRLAKLFGYAGEKPVPRGHAEFLRTTGIRKQSDLLKAIPIPGRVYDDFPRRVWFQQRGRWFKEPGPNSSHPNARWVMGTHLALTSRLRWQISFEYGYPHDSSHWFTGIEEADNLKALAENVSQFITDRFETDESSDRRQDSLRTWSRVHRAARDLFWAKCTDRLIGFEDGLADLLVSIPGSSLTEGRITLDKERLATLRRWAQADIRRRAASADRGAVGGTTQS